MNIVVCIKQVPDTTEIKIDPVKNTLIRTGVPSIMNPFDKNALETGLQLKACFQRIFIKRVHDTRHAGTNQRIFHRINLDLSGIRNLFYTNNDIHLHSSYLYSLSNTPAIVILWIWFVPSKIWNTLQSLMSFSTGYSLL